MRSRKEQVQAHRFVTHRLVNALLVGDPESPETPMRRVGLSVFGSVMVMAIIAAIFGVIGVFKPGGSKPAAGKLIIEQETGVRYLWGQLKGEGDPVLLYPIANYTSARLILNNPKLETVTMSQNSLRDLPRGMPLGIPNAPDSLPLPENLMQENAPWQVCSSTPRPNSAGYYAQVLVQKLDGGTVLNSQAILIVDSTQPANKYLVFDNKRMQISDSAITILGYNTITPVQVNPKVINAIQAGPRLNTLTVDGAGGTPAKGLPGTTNKIGTAYVSGNTAYVLTRAGLVPVGDVALKLLLNGQSPTQITAEQVNAAKADPGSPSPEPDGMPKAVPVAHNLEGSHPAVCATYTPTSDADKTTMSVVTFDRAPETLVIPDGATAPDPSTTAYADRIVIPGGRGVLALDKPTEGAQTGQTLYLIDQQGSKFGLVADDKCDPKTALGYADVTPVLVPGTILKLLPSGVPLSQVAALSTINQTAPDQTPGPVGS